MIQKFEVKLPFGTKEVSVCDICGYASDTGFDMLLPKSQCALRPAAWGEPDVKVGDVVEIFEPRRKGGKVTAELKRQSYSVEKLFYASPNSTVLPRGLGGMKPPLHALCITLTQGHGPKGWEPYRKGEHSSMSWFTITYEEFRMLRQGDVPSMRAVGLLPKKGFLERLFS